MTKPKKGKRLDTAEALIWRALFGLRRDGRILAVPLRIWPDPKPEILEAIEGAIRAERERGRSR